MKVKGGTMSGRATSIAAGLGAALLPKCPLCVAAVLSSLGMGATVAGFVAAVARPGLLALAVGAAAFVVAYECGRRRRAFSGREPAARRSSRCARGPSR